MTYKFISRDTGEKNVSRDYITELESRLGIKFPEVLAEYYTSHNKAEIEEFTFSVHKLDFSVEFIIPLMHGTVTVEKILAVNEGDEYIPSTFVPLAEDIDGEDFYWDSADGKVYYLSMENVENPIPICNSVEQFFEILNNSYEE